MSAFPDDYLPLRGVRVTSLALNLPGPAALMRCRDMGAVCTKIEPPAGDPMLRYCPAAYADMHAGIDVATLDLKDAAGQAQLRQLLDRTQVLITSFRPSALGKLGMDARTLARQHPSLAVVTVIGGPGGRAEDPGHDLTYLAENELVPGLTLPPTLYADMSGALLASEAVLRAVLQLRDQPGKPVHLQVALSEAAKWLAQPRHWGLTRPNGPVGGAHAGYAVYPCRNGRVAVAALEPHFAERLARLAGMQAPPMGAAATRVAIARWLADKSCTQLERIAKEEDLPLHAMPD